MEAHEAIRLTREALRQYVPDHVVNVKLGNSKRALGYCTVMRNRRTGEAYPVSITLSRYLLVCSDEQVRDTILHEVAHAMAPADGHGYRWRQACRQIGASPERLANLSHEDKAVRSETMQAKYHISCECGKQSNIALHRLSRKLQYSTSACCHKPWKIRQNY